METKQNIKTTVEENEYEVMISITESSGKIPKVKLYDKAIYNLRYKHQ